MEHYLDADDLKPLSATCRVMRSWFNQHVRVIKVQDCRDTNTMCMAKWPNLVEIRYPALYFHKLIQDVSVLADILGDTILYALGSTCSMLHDATRQAIEIVGSLECIICSGSSYKSIPDFGLS